MRSGDSVFVNNSAFGVEEGSHGIVLDTFGKDAFVQVFDSNGKDLGVHPMPTDSLFPL